MQATKLYAPLDIGGQVALVTGASAGFGEAIAWRLAELGCKLVLVARRLERLEALKASLLEAYPNITVHVAKLDMRDTAAVAAFARGEGEGGLPAELRAVDILVNNAGLALGFGTVETQDEDDMRTMMETNFFAVVVLTRELVKGMVARNRGHVVNLSSVAGVEAYAGGGLYCASKHALNAYTAAARHELVGTNVRVTTVSPGACRTEFSIVRFKGDEAAADAVYAGMDPLLAADIADNVVYAVTRPAHVQIADILVYATYQSSAKGIARPKLKEGAQ
jgi:NADP-dependent 3-hydroxy acid dehydrogenase YdfG